MNFNFIKTIYFFSRSINTNVRTNSINDNMPIQFNNIANVRKERNKQTKQAKGRGSQKKDNKKDNNDNNGGGGGLLQPIIQDIGGWIQRKRQPVPSI